MNDLQEAHTLLYDTLALEAESIEQDRLYDFSNHRNRGALQSLNEKISALQSQREKLFESAKPKKFMTYTYFRKQQKEAHRKGVQDGQGLYEKYMPRSCLTLLQENGCWNLPYKFEHPCAYDARFRNPFFRFSAYYS